MYNHIITVRDNDYFYGCDKPIGDDYIIYVDLDYVKQVIADCIECKIGKELESAKELLNFDI